METLYGRLVIAAIGGDANEVERVLAIGTHGAANRDALHWAAMYNHAEVAAALAPCADTAAVVAALGQAAACGHVETVRVLLATNAVIRAGEVAGLCTAVNNGHIEVVRLLLAASSHIHAHNNDALCIAAMRGHTEMVQTLLAGGVDIHADGDMALSTAVCHGHIEVVRCLLTAGANVHASAVSSALMVAARGGNMAIIRLLLGAGVDIHVDHDAVLHHAAAHGHQDIARLLIKAGADPVVALMGTCDENDRERVIMMFDACSDAITPEQRAALIKMPGQWAGLCAAAESAANVRMLRR